MENENQIPKLQRHSKQEAQALIEQWKQSGKSKATFCLENNLNSPAPARILSRDVQISIIEED